MDKIQTIIDCPNKVYGYPKDHKGRKSNSPICHCSKTKKIWNNSCVFISGFTEFVHVDCECKNVT